MTAQPAEPSTPIGGRVPIEIPVAPPVGPTHWLGPELTPDRWTRDLSAEELDDLLRLADVIDLDRPEALASPHTFPWSDPGRAEGPAGRLAGHLRADLLNGLGFSVVRGVPVDTLDRATVAKAYLALGRLMGTLRSQNADGHLLGHVRNVGADIDDPATRIYQTDRRQTFHTDSCDAVGLLCLQPAAEGGRSLLVSVEATYRLMVERSPELAARLFEPVPTDRRGEVPPGRQPWFEIPVLNWFDGHLTALYQRQYIESAARFPAAPKPDPGLVEALDLFDAVMNDPEVHLTLEFAPGDMQFVNNHALLHDRTGFVDHPGNPRHLLRLWLAIPGARALPPAFTQRYGSVTVGDRGGILTAGTSLSVPV